MNQQNQKSQKAKRSEFLFCYDARMANPNGDPDENRPRIDPVSGRNLVTEFRLKRTIRDYLHRHWNENSPNKIFIREEINEKGSRQTIEELATPYITGKKKDKVINEETLIKDHIDIRLFGLLFAVEDIHFKKIGPVQFAIGQSLNKVTELPIRMTRIVPTKADAKAGTFGEKSILRYSFIAFHGFLNNFAADEVQLTEEDVTEMIKGAWHGTNELSTTSKYGQVSRLFIRINYKKPNSYIGDLDRYIHMEPANDKTDLDKLDDISQFVLNINQLLNILESNKGELESLEYAASNDLIVKYGDTKGDTQTILNKWPAKNKEVTLTNLLESWNPKE